MDSEAENLSLRQIVNVRSSLYQKTSYGSLRNEYAALDLFSQIQ